MTARNYRLDRPEEDPRFTVDLVTKVADVLEDAGYPKLTSRDFVVLQQALFQFIYGGAS